MDFEIEEYCKKYLNQLDEFRKLITLLSYDLDNIDLNIRLLKLHYGILETREEMREILWN